VTVPNQEAWIRWPSTGIATVGFGGFVCTVPAHVAWWAVWLLIGGTLVATPLWVQYLNLQTESTRADAAQAAQARRRAEAAKKRARPVDPEGGESQSPAS
jgi:fatty acid desaturase